MKFMKWLEKADGAVIDHVYQPIADRLADRSSPKQISLFCLMGDIVAFFSIFVIDYMNQGMTLNLSGGFPLLVGPAIYWAAARRPETTGARNPLRIVTMFVVSRLTVLLGFAFMVPEAFVEPRITKSIGTLGYFCFLSFAYFEACDKRPPARRSVWISATPATTR